MFVENRAFGDSKKRTRKESSTVPLRVFVNPTDSSNLFLHDLAIAHPQVA